MQVEALKNYGRPYSETMVELVVSRIFRAYLIFAAKAIVKVGNRVGNLISSIKKGVELYGLTPFFYCGGDDEDRTRDLRRDRHLLALKYVLKNHTVLIIPQS
jgi:hypothetical protein